jgi:ubiquinone/menaquinone biosynthesis C-methylase UbiE
LQDLIDWHGAQNKDVLEIGLGVGADGTKWAQFAKSYTGVDLTDEAVIATRQHLSVLNLEGTVVKGNAESLPFADHRFDLVYSHGVLHHTPSIENALHEVYRVLKPNGQLILMLYSKDSFNYWLRIQLYFRAMFLFNLIKNKDGLKVGEPWKSHIQNYQKMGWCYFSWRNWPHHCTDGPNCEIANIYYWREIKNLLYSTKFRITRKHKAHFPIGLKSKSLEQFLAKYIGFFQFIWATKA